LLKPTRLEQSNRLVPPRMSMIDQASSALPRLTAANHQVVLGHEGLQWMHMWHHFRWLPLFFLGVIVAMVAGHRLVRWGGRHDAKGDDDGEKEHSAVNFVQLAKVLGPGLMVCLADSDIGGLFTMAQAGSRTGFALVFMQFLLIPVLYVVQEMVVRIGVCRKMGIVCLAWTEMGKFAGGVLTVVMVILGIFATMSEFSGIVAVGEMFGLSAVQSCAGATALLTAVVLPGRYGLVEQVGLGLGACLCVFLVTAIICKPPWSEVAMSLVWPPISNVPASANVGEIILANIGTVVTPWMLFYQASATVEKQLCVADLKLARLDTLLGSVVTQLVMCAVLVTFAVQAKGLDLQTLDMGQVFLVPLQPLLGPTFTKLMLACGLLGSSLLATLVISLGVAWNLTELRNHQAGKHAPNATGKATGSPMFQALFVATLAFSAVVVSSDLIGIMRLNILIQLLNGTLMPLVVGYVFFLATCSKVMPKEHRLRGPYALAVASMVGVCSGLALWLAFSSLVARG